LPSRYIGGRYFDNQKLNELYASSLICINDHHPDMLQEGMVAVKIFDILASGSFAISDRNPGIDDIFGDAVPQYESPQHLRELLDFYIAHPEERLKLMEKGRKIALSHTYEKRTEQFANAVALHRAAKLKNRDSIQTHADRPVRLHLGCGGNILPGWVNIDKYNPRADRILDVKALDYPDNSVDEIFTSHMVEHVLPEEFDLMLIEWKRVIKDNGRLTIRCPNAEVYIRMWLEGDDDYKSGYGMTCILGHQDRGPGYLNRNLFTVNQLKNIVEQAGLYVIECHQTVNREGNIHDGDILCVATKKQLPERKDASQQLETVAPVVRSHNHPFQGYAESDRPRILYVDAMSASHASCNLNGISKAYAKVGHVKTFDYRGLAAKFGVAQMNQMLVDTAVEFRPNLIHLGKSELVLGAIIRAIKKRIDTYVIHFYGDFRWDPQPWVVEIGNHADCTLFNYTDDRILNKYRAAGVKNIGGFWDSGADPDIFYPRDVARTKDVVFMGSNLKIPHDGYEKRRELIEAALIKGLDVHLYGQGWDYLSEAKYETLHLYSFVTEQEFAKVCSSAKITLGINGVNDVRMYASWRRAVNTMASGAFHLTHYVPGMETFFTNRKHLVWFTSVSEALESISHYLTHDAERQQIAEAGREEVLARHTWDARITDMLNRLKASKS